MQVNDVIHWVDQTAYTKRCWRFWHQSSLLQVCNCCHCQLFH